MDKLEKTKYNEVELFETSAVGIPAYGRAVTKSFNSVLKKSETDDADKSAEPKKEDAVEPKKEETKKEETEVEPKKEETEVEPKKEVTDDKEESDKDKKESEEAIKSSEETMNKMVSEKFDSLVKSSSFEQIVEKQVKQILEKRSVDDNKPKFSTKEDLKNETTGSLGAKFMRMN